MGTCCSKPEESVFEKPLEQLCATQPAIDFIPRWLGSCFDYVLEHGKNRGRLFIDREGSVEVLELAKQCWEDPTLDVAEDAEFSVQVVATFLMDFFKKLPDSVIPHPRDDILMQGFDHITNHDERLHFVASIVHGLPRYRYNILRRLCHLLSQLLEDQADNSKMTVKQLGQAWGCMIIRWKPLDESAYDHMKGNHMLDVVPHLVDETYGMGQTHNIMTFLISNFDDVFHTNPFVELTERRREVEELKEELHDCADDLEDAQRTLQEETAKMRRIREVRDMHVARVFRETRLRRAAFSTWNRSLAFELHKHKVYSDLTQCRALLASEQKRTVLMGEKLRVLQADQELAMFSKTVRNLGSKPAEEAIPALETLIERTAKSDDSGLRRGMNSRVCVETAVSEQALQRYLDSDHGFTDMDHYYRTETDSSAVGLLPYLPGGKTPMGDLRSRVEEALGTDL